MMQNNTSPCNTTRLFISLTEWGRAQDAKSTESLENYKYEIQYGWEVIAERKSELFWNQGHSQRQLYEEANEKTMMVMT